MLTVIRTSWPLLLGMLLLMLGNGLQGSLLGVRGSTLGFSSVEMSLVMSAYFAGFLLASRVTPDMIRRVGHVRVFAALGSFVSAALLLFPTIQDPIAWIIGRVVIGFCFCGVYVTAESWLNNSATNENRGQALSAYMIVQMLGIIIAQGLLVVPDPSGYLLFVIPSVLVSIAFAPILLSISPTPAFESTKRMTLVELYNVSPLGCVGMFLMGSVFAAQFGMAAVYATEAGLSIGQIPIFTAAFYVGALIFQYPVGWLSDRFDRRVLIALSALIAGLASLMGMFFGGNFYVLVAAAFLIGGLSNPLYSLLIAYTNDFLQHEDMAAASAGLLFVNGVGAIAGPVIIGYAMQVMGPPGYFILLAFVLLALTGYAFYRMTQRRAPSSDETSAYQGMMPTASPVTVEFASEWAIETAEAEAEAEAQDAAEAKKEAGAV
ncbi:MULTISPECIES: MFS transporter [Marivita]|uniref:MFS transporter n=1 Tax=Marivita cryptomonadis TaxID=505252 RepID=A0A9Q2NUZ9_9RHOB|nr:MULTISPECIES: MFS transporter [Marivita]MCR9169694.1 MFS transporter [Paracoccaceae bacterium]MBM2320226.1 MFS transporter [Marivita cryptomonadis]MBM2329805.1 MFS transporter [Marivita cryptomonadis]MBM2339393.1 MFS transporter [Marivita cryptomonadis]MBM2344051.1 MFS transporter [Marivita cryptomonadis]